MQTTRRCVVTWPFAALALIGASPAAAYAANVPPSGERVVCVSKQINEFIYAIGAQDHLVARDLTSVYPPEITKLPSVGYHRALSAEGILSMQPSVFLTDGNVGPIAVLGRLRDVGVPIVVMSPGETPDDAERLLMRLGHYFQRDDAAADVLAIWKKGMDEVQRHAVLWSEKPYPRVLIIHFGQVGNTYLALGSFGPAQQVLHWAGADNALASTHGMIRLTPEIVAQAMPEVILATDIGFDRFGSAERFKELPGIALTPAGTAGLIFRIDETDVMYFGPRTPRAVSRIAALIHT